MSECQYATHRDVITGWRQPVYSHDVCGREGREATLSDGVTAGSVTLCAEHLKAIEDDGGWVFEPARKGGWVVVPSTLLRPVRIEWVFDGLPVYEATVLGETLSYSMEAFVRLLATRARDEQCPDHGAPDKVVLRVHGTRQPDPASRLVPIFQRAEVVDGCCPKLAARILGNSAAPSKPKG